jgi:hypothetical protein
MNTQNPYKFLGMVLVLAGSLFAPVAYFVIVSVPLTAIAISAVMIGFTSIALANARPYISPEAAQLILRTGLENTAALLEELGISEKAIYLPSSMRLGRPQALVPLTNTANIELAKTKISGRLIVRYGDSPEAMGIIVTTPGSLDFRELKITLGPTPAEIETAVTYVLTGLLDLASSVAVNVSGSRVVAQVKGPRLHFEDTWYFRCLGSPVASIVATVCCEALGKPTRILEETYDKGKSTVILEVL